MAFEVNMKYVSLVLLVFFTSAQVLCMRYAKTLPGDPYDSSTAVLLGEIMKLVMSFLLLSMEKKSVRSAASQLANEVSNHSRDVTRFRTTFCTLPLPTWKPQFFRSALS